MLRKRLDQYFTSEGAHEAIVRKSPRAITLRSFESGRNLTHRRRFSPWRPNLLSRTGGSGSCGHRLSVRVFHGLPVAARFPSGIFGPAADGPTVLGPGFQPSTVHRHRSGRRRRGPLPGTHRKAARSIQRFRPRLPEQSARDRRRRQTGLAGSFFARACDARVQLRRRAIFWETEPHRGHRTASHAPAICARLLVSGIESQ